MNTDAHAALRAALCHETVSTIKQLQNELKREKAAHKRTRDEYEDLIFQAAVRRCPFIAEYPETRPRFHVFQCAGCRKWDWCHESEWPHHTSVVHFKDGFPSTEKLTWCPNCEDDARQSPWEYYARELEMDNFYNLDNVPDGEHVAAALIQIAWYRYKVLCTESEE